MALSLASLKNWRNAGKLLPITGRFASRILLHVSIRTADILPAATYKQMVAGAASQNISTPSCIL